MASVGTTNSKTNRPILIQPGKLIENDGSPPDYIHVRHFSDKELDGDVSKKLSQQ